MLHWLPAAIGLYQLNIDIPPLPTGEHAIEPTVAVNNAQNLGIVVGG